MKLELNYDEVLTIRRALTFRIEETASNALKCERLGIEDDAKFWRESAEEYRKAYNAVEAQVEQADKERKQAVAALTETEVEGDGERKGLKQFG